MTAVRSRRSRDFPLDKLLIVTGGILLPVGIFTIVLGWYGVAHTSYTFEQNSYIVSGGLLGLGLVFTGGFLYFGYWMTRQIRNSATEHQETLRALHQLRQEMVSTAASTAAVARLVDAYLVNTGVRGQTNTTSDGQGRRTRRTSPDSPPAGAAKTQPRLAEAVVATKRGSLFHRPDCPVVARRNELRALDSDEPGFKPCLICKPFD
jgi:hypothetical protein